MKPIQNSRRVFAVLVLMLLSVILATAHEPTPASSPAAMGAQEHSASSPAPGMAPQPQMPGMPMKSSDNSLIGHLKNPDYMHTLLNPLPVYGLSMGVLTLCIGLFFRNRIAIVAALVVIFVSGFAAWPVYYFGEQAYDRVKAMSDPIGTQWLDEHMRRAEKLIYIFYLLAAGALAGILAPFKWPRTAMPLAVGVLALGVVNLGLGGWISYAGGHVRHPEFRYEAPPAHAEAGHSHGGGDEDMHHDAHDSMPATGNDAAKMDHAAMPGMQPMGAQKPAEAGQSAPPPKPAEGTAEQLEASRMQLEASRLQLEASRKQLEATEAAKAPNPPPSPEQALSPHPDGGHDHEKP